MNVAQILIFLSDPKRMEEFLDALEYGMWSEWDCGLYDAFGHGFGPKEIAIAAEEAGMLTLHLDETEAA